MIIVHETFICKPGQASKMAKLLKEVMANEPGFVQVMTDMVSDFNKVVIVSQYESLTAYDDTWKNMEQQPEEKMKAMQEKMKGYHDMFITGKREIYRVM